MRKVVIKYAPLHSSLVNLPLSLYGPLVSRGTRPQSVAVHLSSKAPTGEPINAYFGWTGLASASSLAKWSASSNQQAGMDAVEIDPQLAVSLGFVQGDVVELGIIHDLPVAQSVGTDPISSDDWEILELHAQYLEDNLLSQVRVACVGQEVNVWILGKTRIRFRISSIQPAGVACLLSTNTEVIVAPKTRNKPGPPKTTLVSEEDQSSAPLIHSARVVPTKLFSSSISTDQTQLLLVSPSTYKEYKERSIREVYIIPLNAPIRKLLEELKNITQTSKNLPIASKDIALRGLRSEAPSTVTSQSKQEKPVPVRIQPLIGLPTRHVVVLGIANVTEWDLIRFSSVSPPEPSKDKVPHRTPVPFILPVSTPKPSLASMDKIIEECRDTFIRRFLFNAPTFGTESTRLLIHGGRGSGKTSIALTLAKVFEQDTRFLLCPLYVDASRLTDERLSGIKHFLALITRLALWCAPCLLILDNLDRLLGVEIEHTDSFRSRQFAELFVATLKNLNPACSVIVTTESISTLHPALLSNHLFPNQVKLKSPDKDARAEILQHIVESGEFRSRSNELNYVALATRTEGYSATDLQDLVKRAVHASTSRAIESQKSEPILDMKDFEDAQKDFTPLSLRDVKLHKSEVEWSDIGGLHETRRILRETLEWPTKYAPIFAKCPLRLRSGLLLYGYPGCGKTLLASAVAKECGLNFISVKGPELLNKYIGASEKSVRELFERASAAKPCVLFFDEFESIAPRRGHDSTGVTDRVVNQMLTQMDGAEGLEGVYVLAATSRPDLIDPALLRPGRLDKSLLCHMPIEAERAEILRALARKLQLDPAVDLQRVATLTEGFSGADLQALMYNAHLESVHSILASSTAVKNTPESASTKTEFVILGSDGLSLPKAEHTALASRLQQITGKRGLTAKKAQTSSSKPFVGFNHITKALSSTKPSVSPEERQRLERIYNDFASDRSGELPLPPNGDVKSVGNRVSLM